MPIYSICSVPMHQFKSENQLQTDSPNPPAFLQLPLVALKKIALNVNTGNIIERAKNSVLFGRICILTHLLSHEKEIEASIDAAKIYLANEELAEAYVNRLKILRQRPLEPDQISAIRAIEIQKLDLLYQIYCQKMVKNNIPFVNSLFFQGGAEILHQFAARVEMIHLENDLPIETNMPQSSQSVYFTSEIYAPFKDFLKKMIQNRCAEFTRLPLHELSLKNFCIEHSKLFALFQNCGLAFKDLFLPQRFYLEILHKEIHSNHQPEEFTRIISELIEQKKKEIFTQLNTVKNTLEEELTLLLSTNQGAGLLEIATRDQTPGAEERYAALLELVNHIAIFDMEGRIIGGELLKINQRLENSQLEQEARWASLPAQFYYELAQPECNTANLQSIIALYRSEHKYAF